MAAGIPIVPVIIRNAEVVAARDSMSAHPGTVDVAVFPPISVEDWTVDTLPERIEEVRQLYLDTLADWPVDELPAWSPKPAAPAKKTPAKKTQAKKSPAKKAPAKKAAAKKTPAKKAAAKKAVAKKAPAKKAPAAQPTDLKGEQ